MKFPIPSSLTDLESAPYDLLPYPADFDDDDEAARANSFDELVTRIWNGNAVLANAASGMDLFNNNCGGWCNEERVQALYTLVRKNASLAPKTKKNFVEALCQSVHLLSVVLSNDGCDDSSLSEDDEYCDASFKKVNQTATSVLHEAFTDALACHVYMLYSLHSTLEVGAKHNNSGKSNTSSSNNNKNGRHEMADTAEARILCAEAMLEVAVALHEHTSSLWKLGVANEDVIGLPCRVAYQMIENSINVTSRRAASGDVALKILAVSLDSPAASILMNTIVGALIDLMHSFEHVAPMIADLCCRTEKEETAMTLSNELLRGFGQIDIVGTGDAKASGIKFFAPFISELALKKPRLVLANISFLLPYLGSDSYHLRSAIVTAIGYFVSAHKATIDDGIKADHLSSYDKRQLKHEAEDDALRKTDDNIDNNISSLLDLLEARVYDNTSFTRSATLKSWAYLISCDAIPLDRVLSVTKLAIDRLQDRSVHVRRSAMQVLTLILENNPFMGTLDPTPYQQKIRDLDAYLERKMPASAVASLKMSELTKQKRQREENGEDSVDIDEELQSLAIKLNEMEAEAISNEQTAEEKECSNKVRAREFAKSAIDFINAFQNANHAFETMLLSKYTTDVTEALRFFVRARHFQLPCAMTGMRRALSLMWSTEKSIRDEVMNAFVDVFISSPTSENDDLLPCEVIAQNLLVLVGTATESENASIEQAISELVTSKKVPLDVFLIIWSVVAKAHGPTKSAALLILSMGAGADPGLVDSLSRLRLLLDAGFGDNVEESRDWSSVRNAALALQNIGRVQTNLEENSAKAIVLDQLIEALSAVTRGDWCHDDSPLDTNSWFGAAEQCINAIISICENPEEICSNIVKSMEKSILRNTSEPTISSTRLARLFFVLGHVAIKLLVYTEELCGAVRRSNLRKDLNEKPDSKRLSNDTSTRGDYDGTSSEDENELIEKELGVSAEAEAETEMQFIDMTENELVGRGVLGVFGPLLVKVVANEDEVYGNEILVQSSSLALTKFMIVSSSFCEKHLPLLFTVLSRAKEDVRANIVVALGDLAFRFPNEVEPYTRKIYACLKDKSTRVRRHTMMVLTHLILNDMIKVKGQVCEIAICVQDHDHSIRDMARLLFNELSKRTNNPVYGLLPDIISRLSSVNLDGESFRSILAFLLSFIKKDRQSEMLLEKIIQRFPLCDDIEQKANLMFCIAQLKVTEKSVKTLLENFKLLENALFHVDVYKQLSGMISRFRKNARPEIKPVIDEIESKIKTAHDTGVEDADIVSNTVVRKKVGKGKTVRNKTALKTIN